MAQTVALQATVDSIRTKHSQVLDKLKLSLTQIDMCRAEAESFRAELKTSQAEITTLHAY